MLSASPTTVAGIIAQIRDEGWVLEHREDDVFQLTHPRRPGRKITIAGSPDLILGPKAVMSILNQAGLTPFKG